jgi:hypothetical protein
MGGDGTKLAQVTTGLLIWRPVLTRNIITMNRTTPILRVRRCHQTFVTIYGLTIGYGSGTGISIKGSQHFIIDATTVTAVGGNTSSSLIVLTPAPA